MIGPPSSLIPTTPISGYSALSTASRSTLAKTTRSRRTTAASTMLKSDTKKVFNSKAIARRQPQAASRCSTHHHN
ncbi:hypothetical protein KC19_5G133400 [Ceratodon purpureus]|uniref:Uncharacterized protein n=1 Tax=Ceratodon purpureus TaxID=3225 RepID=A0A8T0I0Z1_CERPU|nr:hypothetical protein KC19_5G133400 [Ceratodon purpureus]